MEPSIFRFILFIGTEVLFVVASFLATVYTLGFLIVRSGELKNSFALVTIFVASVISMLFLMLFSYVLTGQSHYLPFLIIFIASLLTGIALEFFWLIFGSSNVPWFGRTVWAGYEFQQLHPKLNKTRELFSVAILIAFPVYIGVGYFGETFASDAWPKYVMQAILIVFIGASMLAQLPSAMTLMMSRNLMEGTRSRIFMSMLINSASLLLLGSLYVWTTGTEGKTAPLLGEHFIFSSTIAWAVAAYLAIIVVVPYLIGHFRSKHWIALLRGQRDALLTDTKKALASPSLGKIDEALQTVQEAIEERLDALYQDPSLALADKLLESQDPMTYGPRLGLASSVDRDPRFIQADHLIDLANLIGECRKEVEEARTDDEKRKTLKAYADSLQQHGNGFGPAEAGQPWGLVLVTTLIGSVLSPVMASIGKFALVQLGWPTG